MVDKDGDAAVGVEAEEPVFLLLVAHDVAMEKVSRVAHVEEERASRSRRRGERTYRRLCVHSVP